MYVYVNTRKGNEMNLNESLFSKHCNCSIRVERNYMPKKSKYKMFYEDGMPFGKPALICKSHNKWLKWLSPNEAQEVESLLGATNESNK
jgi:hypothetical protein